MNPYFVQNYLAYQFSMRRAALLQQQQVLLNAQLRAATEAAMEGSSRAEVGHLYQPVPSRSPSSIGEHSLSEATTDDSSLSSMSGSPVQQEPNPRKMKKCRFCPSTFKSNTDVTRHERIHTGEKPFSCHICHKQFNRKGNMEKHLTTHFKGADRQAKLQAHCGANKNGEQYVCDCGKVFRSRGFYLRHKKRHETREEQNELRLQQDEDVEVDVEL